MKTTINSNFYPLTLQKDYQQILNFLYEQLRYDPPMDRSDEQLKYTEIFKKVKSSISSSLKHFMSANQIIYSPTRQTEPQLLGVHQVSGTDYSVYLELKATLSSKDPEYQMLMGRFFKIMLRKIGLQQIGRKYFNPVEIKSFDQLALKVWPGIDCKIIRLEGKFFINVDLSFKVMRTTTLYDELKNNKNAQVEGTTVMTVYNQRFYRINRVRYELNATQSFKRADNIEISYLQYYQERYNLKIRDPSQPLIEVIESKRGKEEKTFYIIPEFCVLTGLTNEMRANFNTMKQLSSVTKPKGSDRVKTANSFIQRFYEKESKELMSQWKIELSKNCLQIESSQLRAGDLLMQGGKRSISIESSNLDRDTQCEMFKPTHLSVWAVLHTSRDKDLAGRFLETLRESIKYCNFPCSPPKVFEVPSSRCEDWIAEVDKIVSLAKGPQNINILVLLLPGQKKQAPIYDAIKLYTINKCSIATQVVLTSTINGPAGKVKTICNKILNQIAAKSGGTPWAVAQMPFQSQPTMICGMDIYHSIGKGKQSFLSFMNTDDNQFSRYFTQSQALQVGQEFSYGLTQVFANSLNAFKQKNGVYPVNVIIYRDGVSEAQIKVVIETEVQQFRQGIILALEGVQYTINLIVIIANKKVSAKFYSDPQFDNPNQGTLIDTSVTSKNDFYLISQKTMQGTAAPTHYHIIINDLESQPNIINDIKNLTYKLCYMYYNVSGAIKVPTPIHLAHQCSNFIGDRYDAKKPDSRIMATQNLVDKRSLFFI